MVKLYTITYNATTGDGEPSALADARLYNFLSDVSGVVKGCEVTVAGGNQLHITSGWGIIMGRVFEVPEQTINATPASSGTQQGRLYLEINTASEDAPASLQTIAATSLPDLVQEDINDTGTVYELELYAYSVTQLAVSGLVKRFEPIVSHATTATSAKNGSYYYTGTLRADGWAPESGTYQQTLVLTKPAGAPDLLTSADIIIGVRYSGDFSVNAAMQKSLGKISAGVIWVSSTNRVTFAILPEQLSGITDISLMVEGRNP